MNEHTPGPWRVGKGFGSVVADAPVPEINGSDAVEYYGGHLVAESISPANARLIAAAPDLLEALQLIVQCDAEGLALCEHHVERARAAIRRATGGQP